MMRSARPNILWICTDQQRYDTIGALGNRHVRTPNLDQLVADGVAFERAYAQSPICTPSRASFLTGMYPSSIRACTNGNEHWADAAPLVTKLLADAGYDCGLSGKLHLSAASGRIEKRPDDGYRVFHWSHHHSDDWPEGHDYADWVKQQGVDLKSIDLQDLPPELHQTTWCTDRAIDFIGEERDQPWLFSWNAFDPHPPFNPPKAIMETWDVDSMPGPLFRDSDLEAQAQLSEVDFQTKVRRPEEFDAKRIQAAYYAMIELIDRNVGRMIDALKNTNQLENTVIIFTSDHGETLGDHGLLQKGCRFYEGLVRVPLIIRGAGHFAQGLRSNALVELRDIAPTLLALAGLPIPERMSQRTLLPILEGDANPAQHRDFVRSEFYRTLPDCSGFKGSFGTMIRNERYKLVVYHEQDTGELFDLQEDPDEFTNLWHDPSHSDIRFGLMKKSFDDVVHSIDTGPEQVARF